MVATYLRSIIDPAELLDCFCDRSLDLVFLRYICMNSDALHLVSIGTSLESGIMHLRAILLHGCFALVESLLILDVDECYAF